MSDRRAKAETEEGAEEGSSQQGQRRTADPLHPSSTHYSYYSQQSSAHPTYPPSTSSAREAVAGYAQYRPVAGATASSHPGAPQFHQAASTINPRASTHQVTPDSRQGAPTSEYTSPPSGLRRRFQQSPAISAKSAPKRPRHSGT